MGHQGVDVVRPHLVAVDQDVEAQGHVAGVDHFLMALMVANDSPMSWNVVTPLASAFCVARWIWLRNAASASFGDRAA